MPRKPPSRKARPQTRTTRQGLHVAAKQSGRPTRPTPQQELNLADRAQEDQLNEDQLNEDELNMVDETG